MLAKMIILFATNITLLFLWLTAIGVIIVVIVSITTLIILISAIMSSKLTIRKVLNFSSVTVIMSYDK